MFGARGVGNPVAGAGSFFTLCLHTFFFLHYLFAGFGLRRRADAFPGVGRGRALYPVADLSG